LVHVEPIVLVLQSERKTIHLDVEWCLLTANMTCRKYGYTVVEIKEGCCL
jgi:hypothetical protein